MVGHMLEVQICQKAHGESGTRSQDFTAITGEQVSD